jgi:hypothetical protein
MFSIRYFIFLAAALFVSSARAADLSGSEFFYQPAKEAQSTTLTGAYEYDSFTENGNSYSQTLTGLSPIGVLYEHALGTLYSAGVGIGYYSETETQGPGQSGATISGLGDLDLYLKGRYDLGTIVLHYGAKIVIPNGNATSDNSGNENAASGGLAFDPYFGFDAAKGASGMTGARFTYDYQGNRTLTTAGQSDTTETGGSAWDVAVFYEYRIHSSLVGASLDYYSIGSQSENGTVSVKSYTVTSLDLYGKIPMFGFELLPRINYGLSLGGSEFSKGNTANISIAGRWTF